MNKGEITIGSPLFFSFSVLELAIELTAKYEYTRKDRVMEMNARQYTYS